MKLWEKKEKSPKHAAANVFFAKTHSTNIYLRIYEWNFVLWGLFFLINGGGEEVQPSISCSTTRQRVHHH